MVSCPQSNDHKDKHLVNDDDPIETQEYCSKTKNESITGKMKLFGLPFMCLLHSIETKYLRAHRFINNTKIAAYMLQTRKTTVFECVCCVCVCMCLRERLSLSGANTEAYRLTDWLTDISS